MLTESFYLIKSLNQEKAAKICQTSQLVTKIKLMGTALGGR